jgi:hypothetical protein
MSSENNLVFLGIYSGQKVWEMMAGEATVMRRCEDSFINATQILKAAGFSKPKRTKIIENEIHNSQEPHEKVQGGFGRYQGTW